MVTVLTSNLQTQHVRWPTNAEKEAAKQLVKDQSIPAFRNRWCMVDGTTIFLFKKLSYYGDSFYDRKGRYSINIQIINTLNRQIIDYATGFNRSHHDIHCFSYTRLGKNYAQLLSKREWCWSDVGYPLQTWLIIPYKQPNNTSRENRAFNYALSRIRIWSKHAIDYLKGQFQSLKELCILITLSKDVIYASCWIQMCIILHALSLDSELTTNKTWLNDRLAWEQNAQTLPDNGQSKTFAAQIDRKDQDLAAGRVAQENLK